MLIMSIGGCGEPVAGDGVVIHNYTTTFEGSSITFTCEDGLFPNDIITANCTGEGHWTTDPATYMCTNTIDTTTSSTTNTNNTDAISNTNVNITPGEVQYCNQVISHWKLMYIVPLGIIERKGSK